MFDWDFFLKPICVWTCDMNSRSYFGKMNSTLGSVVPLAMFTNDRLVPSYIKSTTTTNSNTRTTIGDMRRSRSTMQYNSGQYATVTHYRRGGGGAGYQNRWEQNGFEVWNWNRFMFCQLDWSQTVWSINRVNLCFAKLPQLLVKVPSGGENSRKLFDKR